RLADLGFAVPVSVQIPNPRPESFVTVPRVGGPPRTLVVDFATVSVDAWAARPEKAHALEHGARGLIAPVPGEVLDGYPVYRVTEFAGPGNLPDPLSSHSRYTQTFSVFIRGRAL